MIGGLIAVVVGLTILAIGLGFALNTKQITGKIIYTMKMKIPLYKIGKIILTNLQSKMDILGRNERIWGEGIGIEE